MKDIFGSQEFNKGAKVPTQTEWNQLNNSLQHINLGDNHFNTVDVSEHGVNMPVDAFFFPHIAQIEVGNDTAIISPSRLEDWYPYKDTMEVYAVTQIDQFELIGGKYEFRGLSYRDTSSTHVAWTNPSQTTPITATDNADAVIVGYQWDLEPTVTNVVIEANLMTVQLEWTPGAVFDDDPQADLYSEDTGDTDGAWVPSEADGVTTELYEDLINDYLTAEGESPITLADVSNDEIANAIVKVPIGAYNWGISNQVLERVVQLYFGGSAPAASGSNKAGNPYIFYHPFKASITNSTLTVGSRRADDDYQFKDRITIIDPESDLPVAVEYDAIETLILDTAATTDYYCYYELYKNGSIWESTLKKAEFWPPTDVTAGNLLRKIGYATSTEVETDVFEYIWGQELFDCPNETVNPISGEFEPWYDLGGFVTIASGSIETFNGDTNTTSDTSFDLSVNTDIYITLTSNESTGDPDITISDLQSGTYPGMYESISSTQKKFHYKIGEILGGVYIPCHRGRLHIDTTLLTPEINSSYASGDQQPRLMAFSDDQIETVGLSSNSLLIEGLFLSPEIRGGSIQQVEAGSSIEIRGLSDSTSVYLDTYDVIDTSVQDEVTFSGVRSLFDFDRGLMQDLTQSTLADVVLEAEGKWVGIENGRWLHKDSPVTSEGDGDHWVTYELEVANSTDTVSISWDRKGHAWAFNGSTQPGVENYKYRHCTDDYTYPDLVFNAVQANTVISVNDECYQYLSTTEDDVTTPTPTVTNTYLTCNACSTGVLAKAANLRSANSEHFIISSSDDLRPGTGDMTMSVWIYPVSTGTRRNISRKGQSSSPFTGFGLEMETDDTIIVRMDGGTDANDFSATSSSLTQNAWNHLVLTRDAGNTTNGLKVYINATQTDSNRDDAYDVSTNNNMSVGGTFSSGSNWDGYMMKWGFWKGKALSGSEISTLYNSGSGYLYADLPASLKTSLVAYCDMNEFSDGTSTVPRNDDSGNGNTMADQNTTPSVDL